MKTAIRIWFLSKWIYLCLALVCHFVYKYLSKMIIRKYGQKRFNWFQCNRYIHKCEKSRSVEQCLIGSKCLMLSTIYFISSAFSGRFWKVCVLCTCMCIWVWRIFAVNLLISANIYLMCIKAAATTESRQQLTHHAFAFDEQHRVLNGCCGCGRCYQLCY